MGSIPTAATKGIMNKIDLHGVRHEEVRRKVINFIEDNWSSNTEIEIITGQSKKMLDIVLEVVLEYKLQYRYGSCSAFRGVVLVFME